MDLVGEILVAESSLPHLARRAERIYGARDLARAIKERFATIDRIAREMQGAIRQVRMLPVSAALQRLPRQTRVLARTLEKRVALVIEGGETEADKDSVESLAEPLLHLVRASLDYGIEPAAARRAAGKPEQATLRIRAYPQNDRLVIEIADDGRGDDAQATAADAARPALEQAGGTVRLFCTAGMGTTVRLDLPLSLALGRVAIVEAADQLFAIPMAGVVEVVQVAAGRIRTSRQGESFLRRGRDVPLVRLEQLLGQEAYRPREPDPLVLVVEAAQQVVGLVVDEVQEGSEVILRPMSGAMARLSGFVGSALLADGTLLPMLDPRELAVQGP